MRGREIEIQIKRSTLKARRNKANSKIVFCVVIYYRILLRAFSQTPGGVKLGGISALFSMLSHLQFHHRSFLPLEECNGFKDDPIINPAM